MSGDVAVKERMSSTAAANEQSAVDCEAFRLRNFVKLLEQDGDLEVHSGTTKLSEVAALLDGNPKAVLFDHAGAQGAALVGNVMGSRKNMARAFGVEPRHLLKEILTRLRTPQKLVPLSREQAPVQQVVLTGDDIDLTKLPVHLQHSLDGGPYISAAIDFAKDAFSGWTNVGLRRLMLRGRAETGIDLMAPSDLRAIYMASQAKGEHLPVSIVVGAHPIDYLAATMRLPVDELGLIATLRGQSLPVVKSITNDLMVPADAEWVIEGYLDAAGYVEPEGPYGEFLGYYGEVKRNPVFRVTAITHRRDALFQTVSISGRTMGRTDTAQLSSLRTEVLAWRALETAIREPIAVYAPPATGGVYNVRISMRQRVPGEARNAIAAAFASVANIKNVFVVDPDIDIFSDEQMEWAIGTRFQPGRDLVVGDGFRTLPLDPSLEGSRTGSKAGFDLTLAFGASHLASKVPEAPSFTGRKFASARIALEDGPKTFEELMVAASSEDGREVVLELEKLRIEGILEREEQEGRYLLKAARKN
jgi:UbiD family decarboxylase